MIPSPRLSRRAAVGAGVASLATFSAGAARAGNQDTATPAPVPEPGVNPGTVARGLDALDSIVNDAMEQTGVPGVSVAVVYDGEILSTRGYGVTNTETGDPVNADTVFQIASLSKPLASTVVASIIGDGLVTWDTPVIEHFPEFRLHDPWVTREVTIRDMFSHRSGLAEHAGDLLEDIGYSREEVLHRLRYMPLETSMRSTYNYTNFGLTAAAVSAANAAGMSWEDTSRARLYEPAGMTRTSSRFDDYASSDNRSHGHVRMGDSWSPAYVRQPDAQSPAGGVSSTAADMARWMLLQLGNGMLDGEQLVDGTALAETHRAQMIKEPIADPSADHAGLYGLGWNVSYGDDGGVTLGHSGAFALGTGTTVYLLPAEELGIVVLTNGMPIGVAESIALGFLDTVRTGETLNPYVEILGGVFAELLAPQYGGGRNYDSPPANAAPAQNAAVYTGTYENTYFGDLEIAAEGEQLSLSVGPRPDTYEMTHWNGDTFIYHPVGENQNYPSAVTFTISPDGIASLVHIEALDVHGMGTFGRIRDDET